MPQRAGHIIEDLGVEFLPAKPGPFVFPDDLRQEGRRQIGAVVVSRAARYERRRIRDQLADNLDRLGRCGDDDADRIQGAATFAPSPETGKFGP